MAIFPSTKSRQKPFFLLLFSCLLSIGLFAQNDLSLTATTFNTPAATDWAAGENVVYRLVVNNDGMQNNTSVNVDVPVPPNMTFQFSGAASAGTSFSGTTWNIGNALTAGTASVSIELTYQIDAGTDGIYTIMPEISAMTETDTDSTPANGVLSEDDFASACVSVPVQLVCRDTLEASAPGGHTNYQWFKDDVIIFGATSLTYDITEDGTYHYTLDDGTSSCPAELCCKIIAQFGECAGLGDLVWYDENNDGIKDPAETGISGVTVNLLDDMGMVIATTVTDNAGAYSFTDLVPDDYQVQFDHSTAPTNFLPTTQLNTNPDDPADSDADTTTGLSHIVTLSAGEYDPTIDAGYWLPAGLGDYVWYDENADGIQDPAESGINGVTVTLFNGDGTPTGMTTTTANNATTGNDGFYEFTNLVPGDYYVVFDHVSAAAVNSEYMPTTEDTAGTEVTGSDANQTTGATEVVNLSPGEYYPHLDAGYFIPASLGNYVWFDENNDGIQDATEMGINGVSVDLFDGAGNFITTTDTYNNGTNDGFYEFTDLVPGDYYVVFDHGSGALVSDGLMPTLQNTTTEGLDSDADPVTGQSQTVTLAAGDNNPDLDAGYYQAAGLGNYVWLDEDNDGIQDPLEDGIEGVEVILYDNNGVEVARDTTDNTGAYTFVGLVPGDYTVAFNPSSVPTGMTPTMQNIGGDDGEDSDIIDLVNGTTATVTLSPGEYDPTIDAGYFFPASLGDYVWYDENADGVQDPTEDGINGVTVTLFNGDGTPTGMTTTTAFSAGNDGFYEFTNLVPGDYYVVFDHASAAVVNADYAPTMEDNSGTEITGSDANQTTGATEIVSLSPGEHYPHLDAGYIIPASLGDYVWFDENNDGVQDASEMGINGVGVTLYDGAGNVIANTTTSNNGTTDGYYEFTDLVPGDYYVVFDHASTALTSGGFIPTQQNTSNEATDSDADPLTGQSQTVTLAAGDNFPDLDAGYYQTSGLGNYVWLDENNDGIQDPTEDGIAGVEVILYDNTGTELARDTTDNTGAYIFTDLDPGSYYVEFVPSSVPTGMTPTMQNAGTDDANDSDITNPATGGTALVTLGPGEFNPTIDAGYFLPASLGDYVWYDINADGIQDPTESGINGVTVELFNADGTSTGMTTTTSTNAGNAGFYEFVDLVPGDYYVVFDHASAAAVNAQYVPTMEDNAGTEITGSDANSVTGASEIVSLSAGEHYPHLDAGYFIPASLGDYVWFDENNDGSQGGTESGINGVSVDLFDGAGNFIATTTTANNGTTDGYYEFTDLVPGDYYVVFDHGSSTLSTNGYLPTQHNIGSETSDSDADPSTGQSETVTLAPGDNYPDLDAGYYQTSGLGNYVWLDSDNDGIQDPTEDGIAGVEVILYDNTGTEIARDTTDNTGAYIFTDLSPGSYYVEFVPSSVPTDMVPTMQNAGTDDANDSDIVNPVTGGTALVTLGPGEFNPTIDAGYFLPTGLGDYVWYDENADGVQDPTESGINGVTVTLYNSDGTPTGDVTTTTLNPVTGDAGYYEFTGLTPGGYYVVFDHNSAAAVSSDYVPTTEDANGTETTGSDANVITGQTEIVVLEAGDFYPHLDAGYYIPSSLGDYVWFDENSNGVQEAAEDGINGVEVSLYSGDGTFITSTLTSNNGTTDGFYEFTDLVPGDYYVVFDHNSSALTSNGYIPTSQDIGVNTADSDADPITGQSETVTLAPGDNYPDLDAGYYQSAGLGNYVWLDADNDGVQDPTEDGIAGVEVILFDNLGNEIARDTTDNTGAYIFTDLDPGTYYVEFVPGSVPTGMEPTMQDAGGDDAADSDIVNQTTGGTGLITLGPGEFNPTIDAGYFFPAGLGDYVWYDENADGVQDASESGINGVTVTLYNGDGTPTGDVTTTTINPVTGDAGYYEFTDLIPGDYYVVFDHNSAAAVSSDYVPTTEDANGTETTGSDANVITGQSEIVTLEAGEFYPHLDAGYYIPSSLGDYVWFDENNNGVQEASEVGINGVEVSLYEADGTFITTTVTSNNGTTDGFYEFTDLAPGDYYVIFDHGSSILTSQGYVPTTPNVGVNTADSDASVTTGQSEIVSLAPGENYPDLDAGYYQTSGLGNYVWLDEDNDGVQDPTEDGIAGVEVILYDGAGNEVGRDTTDNTGAYIFIDLTPGTYYVEFVPSSVPTGMTPTMQDVAAAGEGGDSDIINPALGTTAPITLAPGEFNPNIDAGYFFPASLGDYVWEDLDLDGVQDGTEPGIEDVLVTLYNGDGTPTGMTVLTDATGFYEFTDLTPGDYYVVFDHNSMVLTDGNYTPTISGIGGDNTDSDADVVTGTSPTVTLAPGENYPHLDAGYVRCAAPEAGDDVAICEGASTNLTATGGDGTYAWAPGTGLSCINCANPVATPDQTTIYVVTSYVGTACEATDTVTIVINDEIDPDFHAEEICPTETMAFVNHTAETPGLIYEWNFDDAVSGTDNTSALRNPTHVYNTAGEYDVMLAVTTAEGCRDTIFETVTVQPLPIAQAGDDVTICAEDGIQLTAAGGDGTYTWTPATGLSNPNIHNPIASPTVTTTYTVTIENDFGCVDSDEITVTVIDRPVIADVTPTNPTDCDVFDGMIFVDAAGTAGAIEYSIDFHNYQASPTFTGLMAGTYYVTVRYADGECPVEYGTPITLTTPGAPIITSVNFTQPTDCGLTDGAIMITATPGTSSVEYGLDDGTGIVWQTTDTFTGLGGGTYTTYVRNDADDTCLTVGQIVDLVDPILPILSKVDTYNPTDCGDDDGRIEVFADGQEGLEYSINGGGTWQSSNIFDNLPAAANYEVMIRYANSTCLVAATGNMYELIAPTAPVFNAMAAVVNPSDCEVNDGTITIDATAGSIAGSTVAIEYSIDGGINWQTSNVFAGLAPGSYNVFMRNVGENCVVAHNPNPVVLVAPDSPEITDVVFTDVTNCGVTDGTITITAIDGEAPLQYSIDGGTTFVASPNFTGLTAGTYNVVVRNDDESCDVTWPSIVIDEPTVATVVEVAFTHPTDCGETDGTITVQTQGGEGLNGSGLEYSIDNGFSWQTSNVFSGLSGMNYNVVVRNNDSTCEVSGGEVTLITPQPPTYNAVDPVVATNPSDCETDDGSIVVNTAQGTIEAILEGTEFSIDGGINWQFGNTFSGLGAGVFNIIIRNENGTCVENYVNNPVILAYPNSPNLEYVQHTDVSDCDVIDGTITIVASEGIAPLQYSIDDGVTYVANNVFTDLPAGEYNIKVTNVDGTCLTVYPPLTIGEPNPVTNLSAEFTHPTECGERDGTITVNAMGLSPLEYSVNGGATWQTSNVFVNLPGNTYTIMVRNADGTCDEVLANTITLITPQAPVYTDVLSTDPTDCDVNDGTITVLATNGSDSDGTAVIEYSIDGGINWTTNGSFTGLPNGSYNVFIRNQGETCTEAWKSNVITLQSPTAPIVKEVVATDVTDCGADDGTITITAIEGEPAYVYGLNLVGTTDTVWQTSNIYPDLEAGIYHIFVTNVDGTCLTCYLSATIEEPSAPIISDVAVFQPTDCGESDGRIEIAADGNTALEYSIDNGANWQSSNVFAFLPQGNDYIVWVRNVDATCETQYTVTNPIVLAEPIAPTIDDVVLTDPTDCNVDDGTINIAATGTGNIEYSIDGFNWSTTGLFTGLSNGTYNIFIRNENNETCLTPHVNNPVELVAPDAPQIKDVVSQDPTECNVNDGFIRITAINGEGDLMYSIDGGTTFQTSPNFLNLAAGVYMVVVTNEDGSCMTMWPSVVLEAPELPVIDGVVTTAPTDCGETNGTLSINASSGNALEFTIDGGTTWQASNLFINLPGGDYDVRVRNVEGNCEVANGIVTILAPVAPVVTTPLDNVSICEDESTPITLSIDQDIIDYEISASGGHDNVAVNGNTITFDAYLDATLSNFSVTLTGDSGCTVTETFNIYRTSDPDADFIVLQPTCANDAVRLQFTGVASPGAILTWNLDGADVLYSSPATATEPAGALVVISYPTVGGVVVSLEVNDGGCIDTEIQPINISPISPDLNGALTEVNDCDNPNGAIDLTVVTNVPFEPGYSFNWTGDNGFTSTSEDLTGLTAGTYYVTVTDQFSGCDHTAVFEVNDVPALDVFDFEVVNNINCGDADGFIKYEVAGGTAPYSFSLVRLDTGSEVVVATQTTESLAVVFENLASGLYEMRVDDAGNCGSLATVIAVTDSGGPEGQIVEFISPECGLQNGSFTLLVEGDPFPFTYDAFVGNAPVGSGLIPNATIETRFTNLASGDYMIKLTDADGCSSWVRVEVDCDPIRCDFGGIAATTVNPTSCGANDGSISITGESATANITWETNTGAVLTGSMIENLAPGVYTAVFDDGECSTTRTYTLQAADGAQIAVDNTTNVTCPGGEDGTAQFTITGNGWYHYSVSNGLVSGDVTLNPSTNPTFTVDLDNLDAGFYIISVRDYLTDCVNSVSFVIEQNGIIEIYATPSLATACYASDAKVDLEIEGGNAPYTLTSDVGDISVNPTNNLASIENIRGGLVNITVTDFNGCSDELTVDLGPIPSCLDTVPFFVIHGTPVDTCLNDVFDLPGNVTTATVCNDDPSMVSLGVADGSTCVTLTPNEDFTGVTELCVVHCDDQIPNYCDTTILIVTVLPPTDTVGVTIRGEEPTEVCVFYDVFQWAGTPTSTEFCNDEVAGQVMASDLTNSCTTLDPADDFAGTADDLICVIHCYENSNIICDTTYIEVTVQPVPDTIDVIIPANIDTEICLDDETLEYPGTIESIAYCDAGDAATVEGTDVSNNCLTLSPATDYTGYLLEPICIIHCYGMENGVEICDTTYVNVVVAPPVDEIDVFIPADEPTEICLDDTILEFPGALFSTNFCNAGDADEVLGTDITGNCVTLDPADDFIGLADDQICVVHCYDDASEICDTTFINVVVVPTPDTVTYIIPPNMDATVCLDDETLEYPGTVQTVTYCNEGDAATVYSPQFVTNECLVLDPATDFTGYSNEPLCVIHCYGAVLGTEICDTTYINVIVTPPSDEIDVVIQGDDPTEVCLDDIVLEFPDAIASTEFCNAGNINEVMATDITENCVTLDPADGFVGATSDQICVVHCYDDAAEVCDTTYINIVVIPAPDTVTFTIPPNIDTVVCLDDETLEYPGTIQSVEYCNQGDAATVSSPQFFMNECLALAPATDFTGYSSELICVIHCYGMISGVEICDTTYIDVIVTPPSDEIDVTLYGDDPMEICLDETVLEFPADLVSTTFCNAGDADEVQATNVAGNCVTLDAAPGFAGDANEQICVIHCYDNASEICDTTYINVTVVPLADTIEVIIPAIDPTEICLDDTVLEFPGTLNDATFCNAGNPNTVLGSALNDNCLTLNPEDNYVGAMPTPLCVTHCYDNASSPSGEICDTTYIFVTVLPPADTIPVVIPFEEDTEFCIPASVLQLPGTPLTTEFCDTGNSATVEGFDLNGDCLTLGSADGYFGTSSDLICVVSCYDAGRTLCDTTYIEVSVATPECNLVVTSVINFDATCGETDGYAIATTTGGYGNLTYNWEGYSETSGTLTGLTSGMYNFTVTDDLTGCTATGMAWIGQVGGDVAFDAESSETATCDGADGVATVTVTEGDAPYSVTYSGPTSGSLDGLTSATFDVTGLAAGTYIFSVSDANGCATQKDVVIDSNSGNLTLDTQVIEAPGCNGANNGKVMAIVGNFSGSYSLTLDGTQIVSGIATPTFSVGSLTAGTYTLGVTDENGCTAQTQFTLTESDIAFNVTSTATATCDGTDGSANVTVTEGNAPYNVTWNGPTTGNMNNLQSGIFDIDGLAAGTYTINVTDANGCTTQSDVTIDSNPGNLTLDTQVIESPDCGGGSNGKVMAIVGNFGGSYSLTLDGTQIVSGISTPTFSIGNLTAGTYMLGVTDANGCTAEVQFILSESTVELTPADYAVTSPTCVGGDDASIVSTDSRVFSIATNGATIGTTPMNSLTAGTYMLSYNVGGCTAVETVVISNAISMTFAPTTEAESCAGNDGSIIANVNGGTAPYSYSWNTGNTNGSMTGIAAGTYSVTVTDVNGCTAESGSIIVEDGCNIPLPVTTTVNTTIPFETMTEFCLPAEAMDYPATPTSQEWCNSGSTNEVMGMNLVDNCLILDPAQAFAGDIATPLCVVTCYYDGTEICDTTYIAVTVEQPICDLQLNGVAKTDATCGMENGSAQVMTNGGTAPLTYTWFPNVSSTAVASDLAQGTYEVTVTDAANCEVTGSVTINNGQAISMNLAQTSATCEASNGEINISMIGGTPDYDITWSGTVSGNANSIEEQDYTISNLSAGSYTVTITDARGCATTASIEVEQTGGDVTVSTSVLSEPDCGSDNGEVSVNVSGTGNFSLTVDGLLLGQNLVSPHIISDLSAGVHNIEVTNAEGCEANTNFILNEQDAVVLNVSDVNVTNVNCASGTDGSITSGLSSELEVFLGANNMGQTPLTNLAAGTYTVTSYTGSCESSVQVTITQPEVLNLSVATSAETCDGDNGTVTTTMTGGVEPYSYNWSNGASTASLTAVAAGTYSVTVIDANNCAAALNTITVDYDCEPTEPCDPIFVTDTQSVEADPAGDATVCLETVTGVASDYELSLDGATYTGNLDVCGQDTMVFYSYTLVYQQAQNGPYAVEWTVLGTTHNAVFQDPTDLAAWMNSVNPGTNWYNEAGDFAIKGIGNPTDFGMMTVTHQATQIMAMLQVNYSSEVVSEGIVVNGMGEHILIATDASTGCTDTLVITVTEGITIPVEVECEDLIAQESMTLETSDCNVAVEFCSGVPIQEILEYNITDNGVTYTGELMGCGYESIYRYNYFSVPGQCSDGPYDLEEWTVNGTTHTGTFNNISDLVNMLNQWDTNGNWSVDPYTFTIVGGDVSSNYGAMKIRHNASGYMSSIAPNIGLQPAYASLALGVGTHELVFTHYLTDCTDTITVEVTCPAQEVTTTTQTITRNIFNGEEEPICLQVNELPGTLVSIENVCPDDSGDAVTFELAGANCLVATGLNLGTGSACIVICDDQGICDTTMIVINVQAGIVMAPPVIQSEEPSSEEDDTISEERRDDTDTNTAKEKVLVYSGFSPNGDGVNDTFTIEGLENYPDHKVQVFNRRGNVVFKAVNYANDWSGEYNGAQLPSNTYFYIIETGTGERLTGYVHIQSN